MKKLYLVMALSSKNGEPIEGVCFDNLGDARQVLRASSVDDLGFSYPAISENFVDAYGESKKVLYHVDADQMEQQQ